MGIPYSRQINAAFDQVTPLVAAGFRVLQTTKNISILLAVIQVLTVVFLAAILVVLVGILISINPQLDSQRDLLVTPAVKWFCDVLMRLGKGVIWLAWVCLVGGMAGAGAGLWWTSREREVKGLDGESVEPTTENDDVDAKLGEELTGEDVENIKAGKSKQ